jgi:S-adenosylmethionine hydrolase
VEKVAASGPLTVAVSGHPVGRIVSAYADAGPGELCALFGSTDHLEIATNGGSAAAALGLGRGAQVHVTRGA